ncbi:hypothetical protein D3C73_1133210 [compost metagenome]
MTQAALFLLTSSAARPETSNARWTLIIRLMYAASLEPRLPRMSSRMASSSRPSSATCSSLRCAAAGGRTVGLPSSARAPGRVLSPTAVAGLLAETTDMRLYSSDFEVDGPGGCRNTRLDEFAGCAMHFTSAQVPDAT